MTALNTFNTAIITYNNRRHYMVFKKSNTSTLTEDKLKIIETLLQKSFSSFNESGCQQYCAFNYNHSRQKYAIELSDYKRQYMAIINEQGETEVWVNCFCKTNNTDWKNDIVVVMDGGKCYFNLKINLTNNTYYNFSVNGEA